MHAAAGERLCARRQPPAALRRPRTCCPLATAASGVEVSLPSATFCELVAAQLECVACGLGGSPSLQIAAYTRTPDSFASGRLRLARCGTWPADSAAGAPRSGRARPGGRLAPALFEALLDDEDVALLLQRRQVTLGSGALVVPVSSSGLLLGLLAADGVDASPAASSVPWAPSGAPWAASTPSAALTLSAESTTVLGAAARAMALAWTLDQAQGAATRSARQQQASLTAFVEDSKAPLAAMGTLSSMLSRQLAKEAVPRELAGALSAQSERLAELTAALEAALYPAAMAQIGAPGSSGAPALTAGDGPRAALPPPPAAPAALPGGSGSNVACDVAALLRPLLGALDGVARGAGKRLLAELPVDEGAEAPLLAALPEREVRAFLSAALQAGLGAAPRMGTVRVSLRRSGIHGAPTVRVAVLAPSGASVPTGAMEDDPGLSLAAAQLRRVGGACEFGGESGEAAAVSLTFP